MKKTVAKKVTSHLKKDNKDCMKENKEHDKLVKEVNKSKMMKKKK